MALNLPNFINAPINSMLNPEGSNMIGNAFKAYQGGQKHGYEMKAKQLANALLEKYGEAEKKAGIEEKLAHAEFYRNPNQLLTPDQKIFADIEAEPDPNKKREMVEFYQKMSGKGGKSNLTAQQQNLFTKAAIGRDQLQHLRETGLNMPHKYLGEFQGAFNVGQDIYEYETTKDPKRKEELKQELAQFGNSIKLLKEAASAASNSQMMMGRQAEIKGQIEAISQGWPVAYKKLANNLPKDVQILVDKMHGKSLEDLNKRAKKVGKDIGEKGIESMFEEESSPDSNLGEDQSQLNETVDRAYSKLSPEQKDMLEFRNKDGRTIIISREEAKKKGLIK